MGKFKDLTGLRFGRFIVIEKYGIGADKKILWKCQCDCGTEKIVSGHGLNSGNSKSCGCYQKDIASIANKTHGLRHHKLYSVHKAMLRRCNDQRDPSFERYGGRGISVCVEWSGTAGFVPFYQWAMKGGYKEGLSIDRINNDGNYEPSNCRWENSGVQSRNQRTQNNSSTGVSGVEFRKKQNDYRVTITFEGVRHSCGCYKSFDDAVKARKEAEQKYWHKEV